MPFGSPAHLLDAARYVAKAWENISATTVKNAFIKADLHMALESGVAEDDLSIDGLISELGAMQISLSNEEFDNNLHLDDDTSKEYQNCLIEEVDEIMEEHEKEIRNGTQTPSSTNPSTSFEEFVLKSMNCLQLMINLCNVAIYFLNKICSLSLFIHLNMLVKYKFCRCLQVL